MWQICLRSCMFRSLRDTSKTHTSNWMWYAYFLGQSYIIAMLVRAWDTRCCQRHSRIAALLSNINLQHHIIIALFVLEDGRLDEHLHLPTQLWTQANKGLKQTRSLRTLPTILPWHLASVADKQHTRIHVVNVSHSPGHKVNSRAATERVEVCALLTKQWHYTLCNGLSTPSVKLMVTQVAGTHAN